MKTASPVSTQKAKRKVSTELKLKIKRMEEKIQKTSDYEPTTVNGYPLDEVRSALQKSIRRRKEWETFYWAYELYDSGMWAYLVRTLVTIAGEDIGLANPQLMAQCMNSYLYWMNLKQYRDKQKQRYLPLSSIPFSTHCF